MVAGLTGGIGSGKSTVARLFEILGCVLFESDKVAKEIYFNSEVREKVIALLGKESYLSETTIDRANISSKLFSDTALLQKLNDIIHPVVRLKFNLFFQENPTRIIIKETALLFEAHLEKEVDKIILVVAEDETRIQRVINRDGLNREDVQKKIRSQLPQEEKIKKAHYIIYNNETELIIPQVLKIYADLNSYTNA